MKVVHASWEKRNLGVDCNEITLNAGDTTETVSTELLEHEAEYTVVKAPTGNASVLFLLQSIGYSFVETMTSCYHTGEPFHLNSIQQRIVQSVHYQEMNAGDVEFMFREIRRGLFQTDRISLDPRFSIAQSNNRYVFWIQDELNKGSKVYKLVFRGKDVGFFGIGKYTEKECVGFLGGIYPDFMNAGFGFCINYYLISEAKRQGAKRINFTFSSNNRGVTALYLGMGYILHEQYYVFVKHNKNGAGLTTL